MLIRKLQITDLRVIKFLDLEPVPGINLITGDNGAGKTTILEAIYLLGRGKSFRHKDIGPFIRNGAEYCRILGDLTAKSDSEIHLGLERSARETRVRKNGADVTRRSELLQTLPLQIITPQSHELVERGPEWRRRFLDYNMFHVEHNYHQLLTAYYKSLKQRNAALRNQDLQSARSFNSQIAKFGEQLTLQRIAYLEKLQTELTLLLELLDLPFSTETGLAQGWDKEGSLLELLEKREDMDLKHGFTTVGIHRSDIRFKTDGVSAAKRLSRGQQKLLVYLLQMAHYTIMRRKNGEPSVFLIDDVAAELDEKNLEKIMTKFNDLGAQLFVTATSKRGIYLPEGLKLFHVEHGTIQASND